MKEKKIDEWPVGAFVRVRMDHEWWSRRGADAMITEDFRDGDVAVLFGFDRSNKPQDFLECVGTELWNKSEFDESTFCL